MEQLTRNVLCMFQVTLKIMLMSSSNTVSLMWIIQGTLLVGHIQKYFCSLVEQWVVSSLIPRRTVAISCAKDCPRSWECHCWLENHWATTGTKLRKYFWCNSFFGGKQYHLFEFGQKVKKKISMAAVELTISWTSLPRANANSKLISLIT